MAHPPYLRAHARRLRRDRALSIDEICERLAERPLTYSVQYHADQDLGELRRFWGRVVMVDGDAISLQRKSNSNQLARRTWRSAHGVLTVWAA